MLYAEKIGFLGLLICGGGICLTAWMLLLKTTNTVPVIPVTPITPEEHQNQAWATNKASNTKFGVICESPASTYSSCYSFTGFYASVTEGGIVTLIDEDHKVFNFVNMGCIIAPADEIGNDACVLSDGFEEEELEQE